MKEANSLPNMVITPCRQYNAISKLTSVDDLDNVWDTKRKNTDY